MELKVASSKLTGNPGTSGWAQVHEFIPEDAEKREIRGHIFAIVATQQPAEGIDTVLAGREILGRLHEEYFGKLEGSSFNVLRSAVEKIVSEFKDTWGVVEIVATAVLGDVVYSVAGGGGQVAIFRNGMLAKILVSEPGKVVSASGYPKDGDMLLVGSNLFFEILSSGVIKAALETKDPNLAVELLAPTIHTRQDTGNLGAAVLRFYKGEGIFDETVATPMGVVPLKPNLFSSIRTAVSDFTLGLLRKLPQPRIYVKGITSEELTQGRRVMVSVGAILILLLVVSIGFGIRQKRIKTEKAKYQTPLSEAKHELDEALGLFSLNPTRSRELFISSRSKAESLRDKKIKDPELLSLISKLGENQGKILGEYRDDPEVFIDLSILSDGLKGDALTASGDKAFVLDRNGKKVVSIAISTKKTAVVSGPDVVDKADDLASYEDRVFILNSDGVFEVGDTKKKVISKGWEGEVLPYSYAGNFYILEKEKGAVWRFPGSGDTFGAKQNWLGAGVSPDFSKTIDWTIDGSVWTLSSSGKVSKFTLGKPDRFSASGVIPEITSPTAIYTNEKLSYLYILEKNKKRVVVLSKSGEFKAQYISDKIEEATDLAVSEKDKKLILLAGSKVYSLELKHL